MEIFYLKFQLLHSASINLRLTRAVCFKISLSFSSSTIKGGGGGREMGRSSVKSSLFCERARGLNVIRVTGGATTGDSSEIWRFGF